MLLFYTVLKKKKNIYIYIYIYYITATFYRNNENNIVSFQMKLKLTCPVGAEVCLPLL